MRVAAWAGTNRTRLIQLGTNAVLLAVVTSYILGYLDPRLVLTPTTLTGGDTASHLHPAQHLLEVLLPQGRVMGWDMGNYAGYPLLQFYFPLPFLLVSLLSVFLDFEIAFKVMTVLGPLTLPLATFYAFRALRYPFPVPAIAAALTLPFLFQEGNSMWGGNISSMLSGEFCHSIGLSFAVAFVGSASRGTNRSRRWIWDGMLLTACGLSHAYAFFFAALGSIGLLFETQGFGERLKYLVKVFAFAFCLIAFWAIPLVEKSSWTTAWMFVWNIQSLSEVLPRALIPLLVLTLLGVLATRFGFRCPEPSRARLFLVMLVGSGLFYVVAPAIGLVDIRFVPGAQLLLCFLSADLWALFQHRLPARPVLAAGLLVATLGWTDAQVSAIPNWIRWNYEGFEAKPAWPIFRDITDYLRGDYADPRVAYEFSPESEMFGTVRAFEAIPYFAGRQTLEGALIHSAVNAPFIYYIQSEISEVSSDAIPGYNYSRFNLPRATAHFRLFNVRDVIVVSEMAVDELRESPEYEEVLERSPYHVFRLRSGSGSYVTVPRYHPVLFETDDWRRDFHRWFRHMELLEIPLVPSGMLSSSDRERFELRASDLSALPQQPVAARCAVEEYVENDAIGFTTNCPGLPHIVAISNAPNWRVEGAARIYPVSPAFMLVFPESEHVRLWYGWTPGDLLGMGLTAGAVVLAAAVLLTGALRARRERGSASEPKTGRTQARIDPLFAALERRKGALAALLGVLLVAVAVFGVFDRIERGRPRRVYLEAWESFQGQRYEEALRGFRELRTKEAETHLLAQTHLYGGWCLLRLDRLEEATEWFEALASEFPDHRVRAEGLYHLGTIYARTGAAERAREVFTEVRDHYPHERWSSFAADRLKELPPPGGDPAGSGGSPNAGETPE